MIVVGDCNSGEGYSGIVSTFNSEGLGNSREFSILTSASSIGFSNVESIFEFMFVIFLSVEFLPVIL